ncbi:MAG: glycosyltransferase [Burkholderiaceae bacterium]|jgi:glycosyltransferase involved in cell wall biosynthesis|nr:glycosyltransferase [Burkholderiaceae bacterium]
MRILQVIRSLTFGGAENHVLSLSRGLRERGHDVLLAAPSRSWIAEQCLRNQLPLEPISMRGVADLLSYWKLHRLIRRWRPDIVHAHQVRPSQYVGIAALGTPAIPVCTAHSTTASKHMRRCRHIIAVADAVVANLVRHHYSQDRITRIYNGVPDAARGERIALREELGIPDSLFAVVCAGRFEYDKGQDVLVSAIRACPDVVHSYFMGDTETSFGREVLTIAGGHPRVHFLGYRGDVQRILPAFDLYVSPSRREALSLSLAEASAARLPIVATRVGGTPEVVLDGETGLLVAADDADALGKAIRRLLSDVSLAVNMGSRARQRYEQVFTMGNMLAQTEAVYQNLLSVR